MQSATHHSQNRTCGAALPSSCTHTLVWYYTTLHYGTIRYWHCSASHNNRPQHCFAVNSDGVVKKKWSWMGLRWHGDTSADRPPSFSGLELFLAVKRIMAAFRPPSPSPYPSTVLASSPSLSGSGMVSTCMAPRTTSSTTWSLPSRIECLLRGLPAWGTWGSGAARPRHTERILTVIEMDMSVLYIVYVSYIFENGHFGRELSCHVLWEHLCNN